jgi:ribosomal protein L37AE/L43A
MPEEYLDHKLECPNCKTIYLKIPRGATESTIITCSQCGHVLGTWGELQDDFTQQAGAGVFSLDEGRIRRKE